MPRARDETGRRERRRGRDGVSAGGEKLVYKQKLRKYITNCNGESEPFAATSGESGLFNRRLEKATLGIYYAILLQGNCVFISGVVARP